RQRAQAQQYVHELIALLDGHRQRLLLAQRLDPVERITMLIARDMLAQEDESRAREQGRRRQIDAFAAASQCAAYLVLRCLIGAPDFQAKLPWLAVVP